MCFDASIILWLKYRTNLDMNLRRRPHISQQDRRSTGRSSCDTLVAWCQSPHTLRDIWAHRGHHTNLPSTAHSGRSAGHTPLHHCSPPAHKFWDTSRHRTSHGIQACSSNTPPYVSHRISDSSGGILSCSWCLRSHQYTLHTIRLYCIPVWFHQRWGNFKSSQPTKELWQGQA